MAKKKININDYTLVTETNRKFCIVLGRIIHIINGGYTFLSPDILTIPILPRRIKYTFWITHHGKSWVTQEESREDYASFYGDIIDKHIGKKLYVNLSEPIIDTRIENKKGEIILRSNIIIKNKSEPPKQIILIK